LSAGEFGGQVIHFNRARVVGGCSAHNAGAVVFGSRVDYDGWAAAGVPALIWTLSCGHRCPRWR
jgi:choline dehydrogenase-like flavoprotein